MVASGGAAVTAASATAGMAVPLGVLAMGGGSLMGGLVGHLATERRLRRLQMQHKQLLLLEEEKAAAVVAGNPPPFSGIRWVEPFAQQRRRWGGGSRHCRYLHGGSSSY